MSFLHPAAHTRSLEVILHSNLSPPPHSWSLGNYHFHLKDVASIHQPPTPHSAPNASCHHLSSMQQLPKQFSYFRSHCVLTHGSRSSQGRICETKRRPCLILMQSSSVLSHCRQKTFQAQYCDHELCVPPGTPQGALF